jgi:hypothetical protein
MNVDGNDGDLLNVRQTAERLGVHENTIRNWARSGVLSTAKLPDSRVHRFYVRDVERLRRQRGAAVVSRKKELWSIGPELVDATQLSKWAATRDAQARFPELVRRLLAATPGITNISARSGEGVALPDWDGRADSAGTAFLPAGSLRLELGVGTKTKAKADEDYEKRRSLPNTKDLIFIFVTPRRWRDGPSWAEAKNQLNDFAGVRVLDADDLEGWLTATPAVHQWISEQLGRKPREAQTLEQWWEQFQARTKPTLPPKLFLTGRDSEMASVKEFLNGPPGSLAVQADWRDEAVAFIALALAQIDSNATGPAVIVHSQAVWDRMLSQPGRATLIPMFEDPDLTVAREQGHHVISPLGRDQVVSGAPVVLPRPDRLGAIQAFEPATDAHDRAYRLAALARRSMPALVRKLASDQTFARPPWTDPQDAAVLAPLILLGSWTDSEGDREVASKLTDQPWNVVERILLHWSATNDPPFVRTGNQWHLASSEEAFLVLGHLITRDDLSRWHELVVDLIAELDPTLDLSADERITAGLRGIHRAHSSVLRRGIAGGIALVGSHDDQRLNDTSTAADHADSIVREILARANNDASGRTWWALSDVLPLLAEAAPNVFLDAVHEDLDSDGPVLTTMFQDQDRTSWFNTSSPHSGLLWALETLCWSSEYLLEATRALARLRAVDPGGRLSNRPLESLQSVLVGWIRHTEATLAQKEMAIDAICRELPDVGWALVEALWPSLHSASMPPHSPRFRDWSPDARSVPVTEWLAYIHYLVQKGIDLADDRTDRWTELVGRIGSLPFSDRDELISALESFVSRDKPQGADQINLWERLRNETGKHRQFAHTDWAMADATLTRLEAIANTIEPIDSVERFAHLFDWRPSLPDVDAHDFAAYEGALLTLRKDAVETTLETASVDGLSDLAHRSPAPQHLGWVVGMVASDDLTPQLLSWLDATDEKLRVVAASWANYRLTREDGPAWLQSTLARSEMAVEARRTALALSAPPISLVWDVLDTTDPRLADAYWSQMRAWGVPPSDTERAVLRLLAHDRPWIAIDILSATMHPSNDANDLTTVIALDIVCNVLDAALVADPSDAQSQTLGYELGLVLDYLEARGVEQSALARYEFAFFRLLEHNRTPRALFSVLATEPGQFVDLVSRVYRGENEPERTLDQKEVALAQHAWWVLHHWQDIPGRQDDGTIDGEHLTGWVRTARLAFADSGRTEIGDELIGQMLAASPVDTDGAWPAEAVREIIEATGSRALESGLYTGVINNAGTTTRNVFDGGDQERAKAARYKDWSKQIAPGWPRTGRLLRKLAESYERDARRHDDEAEVRSDTE